MKLNSTLYVFLSVASLASATEGGTIRGGRLVIESNVDDGKDLKEVKKAPIKTKNAEIKSKPQKSDTHGKS